MVESRGLVRAHLPRLCSQAHLFGGQGKFREMPNYKRPWHKAMKKIALLIVSQNVPTCCLNSSWSFDSSIWHKVGLNEFVPVFDSKLFWWVLTLKRLWLDRCHSMVPNFLKGKGNIWESRRGLAEVLWTCPHCFCLPGCPLCSSWEQGGTWNIRSSARGLFWQLCDTAYMETVQRKWKWTWAEPCNVRLGPINIGIL